MSNSLNEHNHSGGAVSMKLNSISVKLISIALLINTIVLCGLGFYGYEETKSRLAKDLENDTKLLLRRLNLNLPSAIWNFDDAYITSTLESEARAYFIKGIYIKDDSGSLIAAIEQRAGKLIPVDEQPDDLANSQSSDLIFVDKDSDEKSVVGKSIIDITDQKNRALLEVEVEKTIIQIASLNAILMLLFAFAIGRMTRPIGELQTVAANIALGNYDLDIVINRKDEIGELADSFNTMKTGIKKKVQDLRDLNATGDELAGCTTQIVALEKALQALSLHSNVKSGSVYLYNHDNCLELKSFYPPKNISPEHQARNFADGEGVIGVAAKLSEIVFVPDTSQDERFVKSAELNTQESGKSLICVPLMDGSISLGVLNLTGQVGEVRFEESDYEYFETIARQLVTTVKNIRMRETIEEQNRTLEHKVEERTIELRIKNHDIQGMLHNMQQGLFTAADGGQIHPEYSSFLERVFETKNIAGRNVLDLLFSGAKLGSNQYNQNQVAIDSLLGADQMMFEFNDHLLAKEYECEVQGHKKILALDWNPIVVDEEISKLMVTVRDVTKLKALEHEAANQKRELDIVGQLIKISSKKYDDFESSARRFIEENRSLIESNESINVDVLAKLFRNMHTIKGNSRTYGFTYLADIVHDVENSYSELQHSTDKQWDQAQLLKELDRVSKGLEEYSNVYRDVLGRGEDGSHSLSATDGLLLDKKTIKIVQASIESIQNDFPGILKSEALSSIKRIFDNVSSNPLENVLEDILGAMSSIAKELGKPNPKVTINADNIRIKNEASELVTSIFSHILRNSLDHGIELPEERLERGKLEQGTIELFTMTNNDTLEVHVRDDGQGINLERLLEKGIESGKFQASDQPSNNEIAQLIFSSGVSTKEQVSSISGRGVGMDAVKQFLQDNSGNISLKLLSKDGYNSKFMPFETIITLPNNLFVSI
ncbi:MAG: two-component system chemotaxis sensor kinase CheA [Pseudohongiellaceae bacterium]|jgi:two-component system chemotaxis sensor kinase CheA